LDRIKLFIDEDVHAALSTVLRKRGFDVAHAQEVDRKGKSDSEQLEYASLQQRCLMSFNVKDYVLLHNLYVQQRKEHWGIIVSKQLPMGETLRRVLTVLQRNSKESMKNQIFFLSKEIQ
jgi:predicted nuclease of predicted toxin-antitoxin system